MTVPRMRKTDGRLFTGPDVGEPSPGAGEKETSTSSSSLQRESDDSDET